MYFSLISNQQQLLGEKKRVSLFKRNVHRSPSNDIQAYDGALSLLLSFPLILNCPLSFTHTYSLNLFLYIFTFIPPSQHFSLSGSSVETDTV